MDPCTVPGSGNHHTQHHITTDNVDACVDGCSRYELNLSYSGKKTATVRVSAARRDHEPNLQREASPLKSKGPYFPLFLRKKLRYLKCVCLVEKNAVYRSIFAATGCSS